MKGKPLVLVVEDERDQSELIVDLIRETGLYEPIPAYDGEHAFEVLRQHQRGFNFLSNRVECIVLDWQMPRMNGEEFIRKLRLEEGGSPFKRHIPVIISSAYSDRERLQLARDPTLGLASGYIVKPFEEEELLNLLKRIIIHQEGEILREILLERETRWARELGDRAP